MKFAVIQDAYGFLSFHMTEGGRHGAGMLRLFSYAQYYVYCIGDYYGVLRVRAIRLRNTFTCLHSILCVSRGGGGGGGGVGEEEDE